MSSVYRFCFGAFLVLGLVACHKEAALEPSASNLLYTLPQGDHSYDKDIQDFYDTYHTVILYKFDSMDYQYNITGPLNANLDIAIADTDAIVRSLDFIHANWLDLYPSDFLQKTLPFKLMLGSYCRLSTIFNGQIVSYTYQSVYAGLNWVCFGLVNDSLSTLSVGQVDTVRGALNRAFWQQALQDQQIERPDGFSTLTDYTKLSAANLKQYGCFKNYPNSNSATNDLLDYVQVICSTDSVTFRNRWLVSSVDVKGMYAVKYELVKAYYRTKYGVELQAIGNK